MYDLDQRAAIAFLPTYKERAQKPKSFLEKQLVEQPLNFLASGAFFSEKDGLYTFLTEALFKEETTGKKLQLGCPAAASRCGYPGDTSFEIQTIFPGKYNLAYFRVADGYNKYDSAKCGNITFTAAAGDVIIIKGLAPAAIGPRKTFQVYNDVKLPKFSVLSDDYKAEVTRYSHRKIDMKKEMEQRNLRIVSPESDNPEAFKKCVAESGTLDRVLNF